MPQQVIATWQLTGFSTTTRCAVLTMGSAYRVVVTVNDEPLADELHATGQSALTRADDLKTFLLGEGFDEITPWDGMIKH